MNKKQLRLEAKPWITRGTLKSIKRRDKLLRKNIKANDSVRKDQLHTEYKKLRNEVVAIIRRSKKMHYQKYFTENAGDIKKTWTGIKNVINISSKITGMPAAMRPFSFVTDGKSDNLNGSLVARLGGRIKFRGLLQLPMDKLTWHRKPAPSVHLGTNQTE